MKKKTLALVLAVVMAFGATFGATFAYLFYQTETVSNTFTVGNVKIELTEPSWGEEESDDIYPGEALAKDPTVTNIGNNPCFVRVKVEGLDQFGEDALITLRHGNYVAGYDTANWTYLDGYYYYNTVLAVDAVTAPVFNQIVMPTSLEGAEEAKPIDIYAEAVQAQGARAYWADVEAMTVADIAAWFAATAE